MEEIIAHNDFLTIFQSFLPDFSFFSPDFWVWALSKHLKGNKWQKRTKQLKSPTVGEWGPIGFIFCNHNIVVHCSAWFNSYQTPFTPYSRVHFARDQVVFESEERLTWSVQIIIWGQCSFFQLIVGDFDHFVLQMASVDFLLGFLWKFQLLLWKSTKYSEILQKWWKNVKKSLCGNNFY